MDMHADDLEPRTAYEILGLSASATVTEIRAAYLALVRLYHPDKQTPASTASAGRGTDLRGTRSDDDVHAQIFELNEAYAALSTPDSRAAYDARLLADRSTSHGSARANDASAPGPGSRASALPRISAVVELDEFEVKHVDDAAELASHVQSALNLAAGEGADPDSRATKDEAEAESSPIVFVYPCRCGHAFVVHPDELVVTAMLTDDDRGPGPDIVANAGSPLISQGSLPNLRRVPSLGQVKQVPANQGLRAPDQGDAAQSQQLQVDDIGADADTHTLSILSTCSGCSQVIKVVWGAEDEDDDDDDDDDN